MKHTTLLDGRKLVLARNEQPDKALLSLLAGQAWQVEDRATDDLADVDRVDLQAAGKRLTALVTDISAQFVGLHDIVRTIALAAASGETMFMLSPPGYAKSRLAKTFAQGIGGKYFGIQFDAEMTKEDIIGPYSREAAENGLWQRVLDNGLAGSDFALLDEIWKVPPEGNTPLLTLLQDREYQNGGQLVRAPLHFIVSASNEIPLAAEDRASWDRWTLRTVMPEVSDGDDFMALFGSEAGRRPVQQQVEIDELRLMASASELMALDAPQEAKEAMRDIWSDLRGQGITLGPRRWIKTMQLAAAHALMDGRAEIEPHDLVVGGSTLWDSPEQAEDVRKTVNAKTDTVYNGVLNLKAQLAVLVRRLEEETAKPDPNNHLTNKAEISQEALSLKQEAANLLKANGLGKHKATVESIRTEAQDLQDLAMTPE